MQRYFISGACTSAGYSSDCIGVDMYVSEGPIGRPENCYQAKGVKRDDKTVPYVDIPLHGTLEIDVRFICDPPPPPPSTT